MLGMLSYWLGLTDWISNFSPLPGLSGILAATASSYPILACVCTIYSQVMSDDPKRFMVHETEMLFLSEEQKYETPYFEAICVYSLYIVWVVFLGFSGMLYWYLSRHDLFLCLYCLPLQSTDLPRDMRGLTMMHHPGTFPEGWRALHTFKNKGKFLLMFSFTAKQVTFNFLNSP